MNYSMSVDEEKVEALVHTSGLHYSDFDSKNGLPKPWQLMKILESARFFSHHWPLDETGRTFRDYAEVTSDRMTFLITSRMDIDLNLYKPSVPKCPLDIKVQGGYVGSSSLNSIATVQTKCGQQLLSNINQVVSIDRATRRPKALPDWWREKYAKSGEQFSSLKFEKYAKPDSVEPFTIQVVRSDLDGNNHTNWSCYVRYALDGAYHNAKHGKLDSLKDIDKRGLQSMELLFSGESFDDDKLQVYAWQQEGDGDQIRVHIEKDGNFIFQATLRYFEQSLF
ncbi:uncharacterized protein LOC132715451 isoform X2 [Ruditapes philippinarum]|nr:uncharacterized protein LOC132715451 isoform X2 [Ruditapes philippinarum]